MPMLQNLSVLRYLMKIFGINNYRAHNLIASLGISKEMLYDDLPEYKKDLMVQALTQLRKLKPGLDSDLVLNTKKNIDNLIDLQTYRGFRHKMSYPTRGQRTRSNAQTSRRRQY